MAAVSPTPADVRLALRPVRRSVRVLRAVGRWVRRVAGRLPGEYTIGKLDAFYQFREQATTSRVFSILLLTPMPCVLVNLLVECLPLADPAMGFQGSLHFQLRHFMAGMVVAMLPLCVKLDCVPDLPVRSWKFVFAYGLAHAVVAIGSNAVVTVCTGVFPVPFAQFAPTVPLAIVGGTINRFFLQTPATTQRSEKIDQWAAMDVVPIFVYPVFTAVFMTLKPQQQLWLSLLLPVIKRFIRQMVWLVLKGDLDLVGATACTVSHLYHVLFTAMCLQNAKSLETLAAIVLVNLLQMLLNCRDIMKDAASLQRSRAELASTSIGLAEDAVSAALEQADGPLLKSLHHKTPSRVLSTYPGYQRVEFMERSHTLLKTDEPASAPRSGFSRYNPRRKSDQRSLLSAESLTKQTTAPISLGLAQILPVPEKPTGQYVLPSTQTRDVDRAQTVPSIPPRRDHSRLRKSFICNVTSALHQTEIILLRSYITLFVLSFYGLYLVVVFWLPNRRYFATMATTTTFDAVGSMIFHLLLLGSMEVLFLAMYLVLIQRRLGVSGMQQLAFVLSSQRVLIQAKFLTLTLMILGFPLQHYGNGIIFSLRSS